MITSITSFVTRMTLRERIQVQNEVLGAGHIHVEIWEAREGQWTANAAGVLLDAPTPADLLRDLAEVISAG